MFYKAGYLCYNIEEKEQFWEMFKMKFKKAFGIMLAAVMLTGVMAAASVAAEETAASSTWDEATYDTAASSTWDEATLDKAVGYAKTSPNTGAGTALAVILACAGFAGAGIGAAKIKK